MQKSIAMACSGPIVRLNVLSALAICINATNKQPGPVLRAFAVKLMANYDSSDLLCTVISLACLASVEQQ